MFLKDLTEFDFLDFGEVFDAYTVATFNKNHTKAKVSFNFKDYVIPKYNPEKREVTINLEVISQVPEFIFFDFDVKAINAPAAIFSGRVRDEWQKFMTKKFGDKYEEAYRENNKQNYNNKDLLDF